MSNSANITLRLTANGGTGSALTYEDLDTNFLELISVIDDYNAHIIATDAHDAEDIPFDSSYTGSNYDATNVQDALEELESDVYGHINSTSAHAAIDLTYDNADSGLTATNIKTALDELDTDRTSTQTQLDDHEASTSAHASEDITYDNVDSDLAATDVKAALDELNSDNTSTQTQLDDHEASTSAHDAEDIPFDNGYSGSNYDATDVQAALEEIESDVQGHINSNPAHDADQITYDNTSSGISATEVQAALDEILVTVSSEYGELNITNNTTAITLSAANDSSLNDEADYEQITGIWDATPHGQNNGVTQQDNSITVNRNGVYKIEVWGVFESDTNNTELGLKFGVNGTINLQRTPKTKVISGNDFNNISAHGYHEFNSGDVLTLHHAVSVNSDIVWHDMVFSINELRTIN